MDLHDQHVHEANVASYEADYVLGYQAYKDGVIYSLGPHKGFVRSDGWKQGWKAAHGEANAVEHQQGIDAWNNAEAYNLDWPQAKQTGWLSQYKIRLQTTIDRLYPRNNIAQTPCFMQLNFNRK